MAEYRDGGFYATDDGGETWMPFGPAGESYPLRHLLFAADSVVYTYTRSCMHTDWIDPDEALPSYCGEYAPKDVRLIARSGDYGEHWTPAMGGLPKVQGDLICPYLFDIEVDPGDSDRLYAAFGLVEESTMSP